MRRTPRFLLVVGTALAAAAATLAPGASAAPATVSGYVVVLEDGAGPPAAVAERLADRYGGQVGFVYSHALRGFSIRTTDRAAAALASNAKVAYVEADGAMSVVEQDTPTGIARIFADDNANIGINGVDDKRVDVDVAVIDTGIDLDHPDLYVVGSTNCTNESGGPIWSRTAWCTDGGGDDDHYHGTHVAGTVAAIDNDLGVVGVAPGARLWAVKVLKSNGSGSNSMVIAGIDWVAERASTIEVANLSLGGGYAQSVNDAVAGAVADGVSVVVAAGNSAANAANYSPASEETAITVSALADFNGAPGGGGTATCRTDEDDTFANFSNYGDRSTGDPIDIIAPGVCILSTMPGGGYDILSGTSMASPHVAGAVALLRSMTQPGPQSDLEWAESQLTLAKNENWTNEDDPDGVQEPLLEVSSSTVFDPKYVGETVTEPPANTTPTAAFTVDCNDLSCSFTDGSSDSDGTIVSWSWDFGDGSTTSAENPQHSYSDTGDYDVVLTVTDDDGATDSVTHSVTVTAPVTDPPPTSGPTFTPSSTNQGSKWTAIVTLSNGGVGQTYTGTWSNNGGSDSCTTNSAGTCTVDWSGIAKKVGSVTWTHTASGTVVPVSKP